MIRWCDNGHPSARVLSGRRCRVCSARREAARPTPTQRGYGFAHQRARAMLRSTLPSACGYAPSDPLCPRTLLYPESRWVAAHVRDGEPEYGWMAAHPACNERAKGYGGVARTERAPAAIPAPTAQGLSTDLEVSRGPR